MRVGAPPPLSVAQQLNEVEPPVFAQTIAGKTGSPVVFLHGYGGNPNDSVGPPLAAAFRRAGVALDITAPWGEPKRVQGNRVVAFAPTTMTFQLAQIQKLVDQNPGKKLTLIGHSFGGLGARIYATLHPENVERVILMMPGEGVARRTAKDSGIDATDPDTIKAQFGEVIAEREAQLAEAKKKGDKQAIGDLSEAINWLKMCADIIDYDKTAPIKNLKVPTLLVRAGVDGNLSAGMVMSVAKQARDAKVTTLVVPGANHMLGGKTEAKTTANYDLVAKSIAKFMGLDEKPAPVRDQFAPGAAAAPAPAPAGAPVPQADDATLFSD